MDKIATIELNKIILMSIINFELTRSNAKLHSPSKPMAKIATGITFKAE